MIEGHRPKSKDIYESRGVNREHRWAAIGHRGATLWFTGLSGAGKSSLTIELERRLLEAPARPCYRLDGDNIRFGLNSDLGFSPEERRETNRRVAEMAKLFADAGTIALVACISPYAADRSFAREIHKRAGLPFVEVFVDAPLSVAESRDPKGLYQRARAGSITGFTGIDAPYEVPEWPDVHISSDQVDVSAAVDHILAALEKLGIVQGPVSDIASTIDTEAAFEGAPTTYGYVGFDVPNV